MKQRLLYLLGFLGFLAIPLIPALFMYGMSGQPFCPPKFDLLAICAFLWYTGPAFALGWIGWIALAIAWFWRKIFPKN